MYQIYNKNNSINKIKLYEPILIQYQYIDNILIMNAIKNNIKNNIKKKQKQKKVNYMIKRLLN